MDVEAVNRYFQANVVDFPDTNRGSHEKLISQVNKRLKVLDIRLMKDGTLKRHWKLDEDGVVRPI